MEMNYAVPSIFPLLPYFKEMSGQTPLVATDHLSCIYAIFLLHITRQDKTCSSSSRENAGGNPTKDDGSIMIQASCLTWGH